MAEAIPPLTVDIIFNTSGINAGVAKATEGLTKITAQTKSVIGSMSHLKSTMLAVFGGNIATQGFMVLEHALIEAKQEFFDTQVATQRLGQALDNMGVHSEKTRESILKNVEAYSALGFQGAESANAMGTLITATGDVGQSTRLMAMAADLARYKHIDLGTAATILARGTQGSAKAFKELGITLDTTIPKNKAIAKAFDQLNEKTYKQAIAYTKTFEGQMAILKERLQETFNVVATHVLPVLGTFFSIINNGLSWIQKNSDALKVFAMWFAIVTARMWATVAATQALNSVLTIFNAIIYTALGRLALIATAFIYLWNHWKIFKDTMAETAATVVYAISSIIWAHARLFEMIGKFTKIKFFKDLAKDADNASKKIDAVATSINDLKNKKSITPKIPSIAGSVAPGKTTGIIGNVPGGNALTGGSSGGGSGTIQYVTVYASNTNDIYKNLSKAAKNGVPLGSK